MNGRVLAILSAVATLVTLAVQLPTELSDDGAFFLRYAEHTIQGMPWTWNPSQPPVWGASAPFYPFLLAIPLLLGASPLHSAVAVGMALHALGIALLSACLFRRVSPLAAVAVVVFSLGNASLSRWVLSGMETPLTLLLLTACVCTLLAQRPSRWSGLLAGAVMVHKMDLIPIGLLYVLCAQRDQPGMRHLAVAVGILCGWHAAAWLLFGMPIPQSLWTKLIIQGRLEPTISWGWFAGTLFTHNGHIWLSMLAGWAVWTRKTATHHSTVLFLLGTVAVFVVGYTVRRPFEPYSWYLMPALHALVLLAGLGIGCIGRRSAWLAAALLFAATILGAPAEQHHRRVWQAYLSHQERDRADAGRWVDTHTPQDATVLTAWGNPALYAQREVVDAAFLHMPFVDNLMDTHRPDVLILQGDPGSSPQNPSFSLLDGRPDHYTVVQIFDHSFQAGVDYYFAVLLRSAPDSNGPLPP